MRSRNLAMLVIGLLLGALALGPALAHHQPGHTKKQVGRVSKRAVRTGNELRADATAAATLILPLTVGPGSLTTLISHPPFTVKGDCRDLGGTLETYVFIETTEEGTQHSGDDTAAADTLIGPGTPQANRTFEDPGAESTGPPEHSDGFDDQFSAIAPSGTAIEGTISSMAAETAGQCRFYGRWTASS